MLCPQQIPGETELGNPEHGHRARAEHTDKQRGPGELVCGPQVGQLRPRNHKCRVEGMF